ncbi:hypothetical protein E5Q_05729 [Mixia osmundae IAM 14324]|uniref:HIG1 domain-containing protein n=1 Tax=Mixia osmundae (strain CBS 9802 / IAM 14324 / JCM 22182 / KY 12970) TaxID=764103 RepID=G7E880_MIXOS|nr:hypothetical protein E5Q_05729 [Mixia osmundae IAM 14324]
MPSCEEASTRGALVGAVLAVALVGAQRAKLRVATELTIPLKAFLISAGTTAGVVLGGDSASRQFDVRSREKTGQGQSESNLERKLGIDQRVTTLSEDADRTTRLTAWGKEHRYGIIFGSWGLSMIGSFAYVASQPMTTAQKIVQARMVAQGLTLAVLIASAGLAAMPNEDGESEDDIKRRERENSMYRFKADSPHEKHLREEREKKERHDKEAAAEESKSKTKQTDVKQ